MTPRPFDTVCARLLERTGHAGRNGSWRCPAHDDSSPSLSVSQTNDGTVLLHCHAGCTAADVLAALDLDLQDLFGKPKSNGHDRPEIVARYRYVDEDRQLLFEVVRYHPKAFKQRRPDGNGDWAWNLRGVRRVLYNLPDIITAKQQAKMIVVVEGEKDADAVMRAGGVATTCPQGAGKWKPEYTKTLAGHTGQIIVVADRDEPGLKHARKVAVDLRAAGCEVHLCQPATGKDVADHLGAGLTLEDLELLAIDEPAAAGKAQPDESEEFDDVPDVPGFVVLNDLRDWLAAHVAFQSPHHAPTVALWCAHTHALDLAASTPRIAFESPEPESGKTRTLELMECVCHRGRLVLQMSAASVYRWVEAIRPALLIDEIDAVFGPKASKDHEDLRALVNAGHRRGATVPRVDPNSMKVIEFSCFAPVALAGIAGGLPDTMRSRSIRIPMRRRAPDETVKPFLEPVTRPEGEALRRRIAAWVKGHADEIPLMPDLPDGVTDRQADQWWPLVALADAAGSDWPRIAREACAAIVVEARGNTDDQSLGIRLLADIHDVFDGAHTMFTAELLAKLHALEEAPWGDLRGSPIDSRWLARKLRSYDENIRPRTVRVGDASAKGYTADMFHEAWSRYVHPIRHKRHMGNSPASDVTDVTDVTDTSPESDTSPSTTESEER